MNQPIILAHPTWETGFLLTTFPTTTSVQGLLRYGKLQGLPGINEQEIECQDIYQPYIIRAFGGYNHNGAITNIEAATRKGLAIVYAQGHTITHSTHNTDENLGYTPMSVANKINQRMPHNRRLSRKIILTEFSKQSA